MRKNYIETVKNSLFKSISNLEEISSLFLLHPDKDFTRKRKIDFQTFIKTLLTMSGNSLNKELLDFFDFAPDVPTVSAFNQQRAKVLPEAFEYLFHDFINVVPHNAKTFRGYRLIACDGSNLTIATNPNDAETYVKVNQFSGNGNRLHLNAFYDLMNRTYSDAIVQTFAEYNEFRACIQMIERSKLNKKTILIADRGYENYNIFAHVIEKGWKFLIRVKDKESNGILSGLHLKQKGEFDTEITINLTRSQTKSNKEAGYKFMPTCQVFDFLPIGSKDIYTIKFRVVRLEITENVYETLITNLDNEHFKPIDLKELYGMRWGIETSFRELKYAIGLTSFHAKKVDYIKQEIFARLTLYNYCELITTSIVMKKSERKQKYQVNFTFAIYVCREYLRDRRNISPPDVELLIQKHILPIRPGRRDPRKVKPQSMVSFLYRVA